MNTQSRGWLLGALLAAAMWTGGAAAAERMNPLDAAQRVDELLAAELRPLGFEKAQAERISDQAYLRRVSLDLVGAQPGPVDITLFALDTDPEKREAWAESLLADPRYGQNWARYWRDVILARSTDVRGLLVFRSVEEFLTAELNAETSWKGIAQQFITAQGDVQDNGATAIFMVQLGEPEDVTAEIARLFLGIQIQCAQCHDHPTDRWKREQFHQLTAFLPRTGVRPVRREDTRSYEVVSFNRAGVRRPGALGQRKLEHFMSDLNDPTAEGKLMTPQFFVTGRKLELGTPDAERRETLANWITADSNPWFARSVVNRLWSELVGEGFYEPVDDMGPDRECSAPETLNWLARQFALQGHDLKWLLATVVATDAYQRESRPRRTDPAAPPFAAACPQRLRGDQLFNSLLTALGMSEGSDPAARGGFSYRNLGVRKQFNDVFGYDPSQRREEITSSVPQALFMMNSPSVNAQIDARASSSPLARLLEEFPGNEDLAVELYLRCLAREPSERELATCQEYVKQTGDRIEAFEDLLWCLINSTEFLHRR